MTDTLIRSLIAVDGEPDDADNFDLSLPPSTENHAYRLALIADSLEQIEERSRELQQSTPSRVAW